MKHTILCGSFNSSISSITEFGPITFHESQYSNVSSLSHLTLSNGSFKVCIPNCVTQGPRLFETSEQSTQAPKKPVRLSNSRHKHSSRRETDLHDSDSSLSLEEIIEESLHSCSSSTTTPTTAVATVTSRQWCEGAASPQVMSMPIRADSVSNILDTSLAASTFASCSSWASVGEESQSWAEDYYDDSHHDDSEMLHDIVDDDDDESSCSATWSRV